MVASEFVQRVFSVGWVVCAVPSSVKCRVACAVSVLEGSYADLRSVGRASQIAEYLKTKASSKATATVG